MIWKINVMHLVICFHDKLTLESKTFVQSTAWKDWRVKGRAMGLVMGLMSLAIIGILSILSPFFCFLGLSVFLPSSPLFHVEVCVLSCMVLLESLLTASTLHFLCPNPHFLQTGETFYICLHSLYTVSFILKSVSIERVRTEAELSYHQHTLLTSFLFVCLARQLFHISTEQLGEYHLYASLFSFSVLSK